MTFQDVMKEYENQFHRACSEWQAFKYATPYPTSELQYKGFNVNYEEIDLMLVQAAMHQYGFTMMQAHFMLNEARCLYESCYPDMILGMPSLCDIIIRFNKQAGRPSL